MASRIRFFIPCYVDELWPQAARAAVELAEAVGFRVQLVDAVCCGQALSNAGAASGRLEAVFEAAAGGDDSEIIVLSASCTGHLDSVRAPEARPAVVEWCEWFARHAPDRFPNRVERCVALHGSCSALRSDGRSSEVRSSRGVAAMRDLLSRVDGLVVADPAFASECCGFGGSFATTFPELSVRMGKDKLASLRDAGSDRGRVDGIVSSDCSCLLHLRAIEGAGLPFYHVAEILRSAA
ncbi:MAG: (Fe-S)-binding protein [Planctomycetes bacterium]|nr:(Fe-S)-binding protein [Planctomycetota bacterium]MCB9919559.1 (Fe-S)-binding protein [Planctomycetota bacterium]